MKRYFIFLATALLTLAACNRAPMFVEEIEGAHTEYFQVYSTNVTDLSKGIPAHCAIPADDGTKTTSIPVNNILSLIFENARKGKVIELAGSYESYDFSTGETIRLSGKVLLPKDRKPKRYIVVSHYTIGANSEAPSNLFPLEGILCDMDYAMIFPDYQGFGIDRDRIHPYLVMEQTALDVIMMYLSVANYLKGTKYEPEYDDIYLMGFSQGGAVTMSTQWMIEEYFNASIKVHQVFAGGGPYDVRATFNNFVETDKVNIAPAVPYVIQGMIEGYGTDVEIERVLQPWVCEKLDPWINSKDYTVNQLREMMATTKTSDLLTPEAMDRSSDLVAELYKAMTENSIVARNWTPEAPVYLMHSIDDDVVPYVNAIKAKDKWKDGNIQYNLGHYGSHMQSVLRFIYSVQTWLKDTEEQRNEK